MPQKRHVFYLFLIWLCLLLYMFNSFYLKRHSSGLLWYFSICYFNDLIAPVVVLSIANLALSFCGLSMKRLWQVLLFSLVCGLFWEFGTLLFNDAAFIFHHGATFDPADFLTYLAGGGLFLLIIKVWGIFYESGNVV